MPPTNSNALLPPMDEGDFHSTEIWQRLSENPVLREECFTYLAADSETGIQCCPNPRYYYASYDKEVFDECYDYLRLTGERRRKVLLSGYLFEFFHTNVGEFISIRSKQSRIWGFMQSG